VVIPKPKPLTQSEAPLVGDYSQPWGVFLFGKEIVYEVEPYLCVVWKISWMEGM
jgi:hypothetical protein